jgi:hypothetical protein
MEFVITHRNKKLSAFYIKLKSGFDGKLLGDESSSKYDGFRPEKFILNKINEGVKFYTYNKKTKSYIEVTIVDNNIKSVANDTSIDNLKKLPIYDDN